MRFQLPKLLLSGVLSTALAATGILTGVSAACADPVERYWTVPSSSKKVDYSSILKTYGTLDGAAGADILGITNTNYDFSGATAGEWSFTQYSGYNYNTATSSEGAGLALWGTNVNENPNLLYYNLFYNAGIKGSSGGYTKSAQAATTWASTPYPVNNGNDSGWGDAYNAKDSKKGSSSKYADSQDVDGLTVINGLEYHPDIIYGASKTTNFFNADNSKTNISTWLSNNKISGYNPTFVSADATNAWTQIYSLLKLASATEKLKKQAAAEGKTLTTRYDNNNAMTGALSFEKSIRGNLLYVASQIDQGKVKEKRVAYLYSISGGTATFLTPEASGLWLGSDTGNGTVYDEVDDAGLPTGNQTRDYAEKNNGGTSAYAANNTMIDYDCTGVLPFCTKTFTGNGSSMRNLMKIGGVWKKIPVTTLTDEDSEDGLLGKVDVIIYNTDEDKVPGGKDLVTGWAETQGFNSTTGKVIAGSDFGNSDAQNFDDADATEEGMSPLCYNQRDWSVDKLSRMAWCFSQVYPELYDGNANASYGYWVDKVYHVKTASVAKVVKYMTNQSGDVVYDEKTAQKMEERYQEGLDWWLNGGDQGVKRRNYIYYMGSTRASYFTGNTSASVPAKTIGIYQPSDEWLANQAAVSKTKVTLASSKLSCTGKALKPQVTVKTSGGTRLVEGTDYSVSYSNNVSAGTGKAIIKGKGNYVGTKTMSFTIAKGANPVSVTAKAKSVKASAAKKKAVSVKAITVKGAQGKLSYRKASGAAKLTVNAKTGKVTVKKGAKKGTYKAKVKVTAAGNASYLAASKTVSITVKVK